MERPSVRTIGGAKSTSLMGSVKRRKVSKKHRTDFDNNNHSAAVGMKENVNAHGSAV